ncbi:target of rapamycin complex subunit lst8 isoform X2 [Octopus sinensis]|nr:target of rapamycin complex subunit lst8 isoform X2 [Octopus sinensis]
MSDQRRMRGEYVRRRVEEASMNNPPNSADPVILVTGGYDHGIRFWHAYSGVCSRTVQFTDSQVNDLEITPDRQFVAGAGFQHIRMFDINSKSSSPLIDYEGLSKNVTAVGFQEDGKWMYSGGEDMTTRIWDQRSRNPQSQRMFAGNAPVNCVCLHPNQGELFIGDQNGVIHVWDLKSNHKEPCIPELDASIQSICIDPMGTMMACVNNKGRCYVWSLSGSHKSECSFLHKRAEFQAHKRYALKCMFSPDSTLLATTSADCSAVIWKTADFSKLTELKDNTQRWVWDCAFSGDSQYIITASSDNVARLWSVESGEVRREYKGHQKAIISLAFRDEVLS